MILLAAVLVGILTTFRVAPGQALDELFSYFQRPWTPRRFPWVLVHMAAVFSLGILIVMQRPIKRALPIGWQRLIISPLCGMVLYSLFLLFVGLNPHSPRKYLEITFSGALYAIAAGLIWLVLVLKARRQSSLTYRLHFSWYYLPPILAWIVILCLAIPHALSPAIESDELRYHLAAPAQWLRMGQIKYLPYQAFSNFPMPGEMLYMAAMAIGNPGYAKLIHLMFLPICGGLIALITREILPPAGRRTPFSRAIPLYAGTAFALIPSVPILAAWGFTDLFVTAFFLGFIYVAARALRHPDRFSGVLVGLVAAGAVSTKYTMVPLIGFLGLIWMILLIKNRCVGCPRNKSNIAIQLILTLIISALFASPWFIRNWLWTRNPFYPLAYSVFGGGEWSIANAAFYTAKAGAKGFHLHWLGIAPLDKIVEFLITPFTTTFYPFVLNRTVGGFEDHFLGPLPLTATILSLGWAAMWTAQSPPCARACLRFGPRTPVGDHAKAQAGFRSPHQLIVSWILLATLASWALWFVSYQSNRLLLPTLGLVLAIAGAAAAGWSAHARRLQRLILYTLLTAGVVVSLLFCVRLSNRQAIAAGLGFKPERQYLAGKLNYYSAAQWLGERIKPGETALLVGEHRPLYFNYPTLVSDWFDTPQPFPLIRATQTNDELLDAFLKQNIRYVFLNVGELNKYIGMWWHPLPEGRGFTPAERARFETLWTHPRLGEIYRDDQVRIYEVAPAR